MPPIRPASKSQMLSASVCSSAPPALAVDRRPNQDGPTPLLHPHYQASSLLRAGPSLHCPGSVLCPLRVLPLGVLPLASDQALTCPSQRQGRSFPRSTLTPESGSRRLYAGCHLGSKQVSPRLVPSTKASSVSTSLIGLSTRSSTVHFRSPSQFLPDALSRTPFPQRSPPRPLGRRSWRGFGASSCEAVPGDLPPSPTQHHFRLPYLHRINPPCSWRNFCPPTVRTFDPTNSTLCSRGPMEVRLTGLSFRTSSTGCSTVLDCRS